MTSTLHNLGFDDYFESFRKELIIELNRLVRVTAQHKGLYFVKNAEGEYQAKVTGKQMFDAASREDFPAVGDWVVVERVDETQMMIEQVLPRRTVIRKTDASRKSRNRTSNQIIAANVDVAFIVESVDRDYSLNRLERYFALAEEGKIQSAVILNKIDLISDDELAEKIVEIKGRFAGCLVIPTSTVTATGLEQLENNLTAGKTYCLLGSSGVGKSTLVNSLIGREVAATGAIIEGVERGRHVTTHRELYFLESGAILIDNPGMREVGLVNSEAGVQTVFDEIEELALTCKFPDCSHTHEAGCAVLSAVESGELNRERYNNYMQLAKETAHYDRTDYENRDKDKKLSKHIKKSLKRMDEFEDK